MNINTAYTIYNNGIQSVEPQLAEAIDRIIDDKNKQLEKLDQVELAEVKARIELEAVDGYYSTLLKKRVLQVEALQEENKQLRTGIVELCEYIGYQPHSDLLERITDILYDISQGSVLAGESK